MKLLAGFEGIGHHIFMDNYYTSPSLFKDMGEHGFGACGTVRIDRKGMPEEWQKPRKGKGKKVTTLPKPKKGEIRAKNLGTSVLALQWMDRKLVSMLTNLHDNTTVIKTRRTKDSGNHQEQVTKPLCIDQYNRYMAGVDKSDQLLSYYGFNHKTLKWTNRVAFHLLDLAIVNSYILYKLSKQDKKHLTHSQFRIDLAKYLLLTTSVDEETGLPAQPQTTPGDRLCGRHFPGKLPQRESGKQSQRECVVCSQQKGNGRKTTTYACKSCNVALCIVPCFELYHTHANPQRYL